MVKTHLDAPEPSFSFPLEQVNQLRRDNAALVEHIKRLETELANATNWCAFWEGVANARTKELLLLQE